LRFESGERYIAKPTIAAALFSLSASSLNDEIEVFAPAA
jgi:hypothetical protein